MASEQVRTTLDKCGLCNTKCAGETGVTVSIQLHHFIGKTSFTDYFNRAFVSICDKCKEKIDDFIKSMKAYD